MVPDTYPRTPVFYGLSDDGVWRRVSHSFDAVAFLQEMLTLPEKGHDGVPVAQD